MVYTPFFLSRKDVRVFEISPFPSYVTHFLSVHKVGEMKDEMSLLKQNQEKLMSNIVTITNVGEWKQVFAPITMDQPNGLTQ